MKAPVPVLLFDGECGLCNRTVRLLLRLDAYGRLRFSPLQGFLGQAYLRAHGLPPNELSTVVFVPDWDHQERPDFRLRTAAIVAALQATGPAGAFLGALLWLIPRPLRDAGYRLIARWRHKVFGAWRACPLPKAEWRTRILE